MAKRILGLAQLSYAQLPPQPNKKYSLSLLLDESQLPGVGWRCALQQSFKGGALRRRDPIGIRAKSIKSTSARRLFKNAPDSDSVLIEVTPLASHDDAVPRVDDFAERLLSGISDIANVTNYEVIEQPGSCDLRPFKCLQYQWKSQGKLRTTRGVAGAVGDIYVHVNHVTLETSWDWQHILDLANLEVRKIRTVTGDTSA